VIRHVVLVKFRADVPAAERRAIYEALAALRGHLPGILAMSFGPTSARRENRWASTMASSSISRTPRRATLT